MRKYIDILNEALSEDSLIDATVTRNIYDPADDEHYDARARTGFFGAQASGCVMIAKDTGRILLVLRSAQVDQPHTWGNLGGAHSASERPVDAARREAKEETGYTGNISMIPLYVFKKDTFRYSNFLGIVDSEFKPHLGWEADRAMWVELGRWPNPLHFGLKALFGDAASMAVIKRYAEMFKHGDHPVEAVEENLNLPAGVDIAKAVGDAHDVAKELADEDGDVVNGSEPDQGGSQPKSPTQPVAKKSLAPIKPQ